MLGIGFERREDVWGLWSGCLRIEGMVGDCRVLPSYVCTCVLGSRLCRRLVMRFDVLECFSVTATEGSCSELDLSCWVVCDYLYLFADIESDFDLIFCTE